MQEKIRGSALKGYLDFIKKKWGQRGVDACVKATGVPMPIKEGDFYDDKYHLDIMSWISSEKGMEYLEDAGKFIIHNLGLLSYLVRFTSPHILLARFPKSYKHAYNFGSVETIKTSETTCTIRFHDALRAQEAVHGWKGMFLGGMEICKVTGTVGITKNSLEGDEYTEYKLVWE